MKRAPCLRVLGRRERHGTIAFDEFQATHAAYIAKHTGNPHFRLLSADKILEFGGFGYSAVEELLGRPPVTWVEDTPAKLRGT